MTELLAFFNALLHGIVTWAPWLAGSTLVGYAMLFVGAIFFPLLASWLQALTPIIRWIADLFVDWMQAIWFGFLDMVDNIKSIIFMLTVAGLTFYMTVHYYNPAPTRTASCEATIAKMRQDFRFVPRTPQERKLYLKQHGLAPSLFKPSTWGGVFN